MNNTVRVHRIGSITSGVTLVVFGCLFMLHIFADMIDYTMIYKLWPFIIIGLGIEIIFSNTKEERFIYDISSIVIMLMLTFFAVGMAGVEMLLERCNIGM